MVTMREVAAAAGVSVATVSRVLNEVPSVNATARSAVHRAVAELGYRPNQLASSLRRQRTRTVAMVVPHIANPFFPRLIQSVERALTADAHELLLADSQDDPDTERDRVRALIDRQVDGVLLVPCHEHDSAATLAVTDVPYVLLDRTVAGIVSDRVLLHDAAGIAKVAVHLREEGRRSFAFVSAEPTTSTARTRLEAFRVEAGADAPTYLGDFSLAWGRQAAGLLLDRPLPDAVICGNDLVAIGVMRGLRDGGVDLPRDVAVTGYDDVGFAEVSHPPLTTIRQPIDRLGQAAVALLLDRAGGQDPAAREVVLVPELVVRASSTGGPA